MAQSSQYIWMEIGMLFKFVNQMNLILIFISFGFFFKGENCTMWFCPPPPPPNFFFNKLAFIWTFTDWFQTWYDNRLLWTMCILISGGMTSTFIQGHSCLRNQKNFALPFFQNFSKSCGWNLVCCQSVALLMLILNLFCTVNIQGSELCLRDIINYTLNICRHPA